MHWDQATLAEGEYLLSCHSMKVNLALILQFCITSFGLVPDEKVLIEYVASILPINSLIEKDKSKIEISLDPRQGHL